MKKADLFLHINARIALLLVWFAMARCGMADDSSMQVGYFTLWSSPAGVAPAGFVDSIDAWPGLSAQLAPRAKEGDSWRVVPSQIDPGLWLSLVGVQVKDGRQCDFFVFSFSDRKGTVRYAGRRPSRVPMQSPRYWFNVPPGPNQLPGNAIVETATDYLFRAEKAAACERPLLRITIKPWSAGAGEAVKASDAVAAHSLPVDMTEAMSFAAAFEAGWRPTSEGEAKTTLAVSMAEEAGVFVSVKAENISGSPGFARHNIPREALYNNLVSLFRCCRDRAHIMDGCAFCGDTTGLLGWVGGRLILTDGVNIKAVDPQSGRTSWQISGTAKQDAQVDVLEMSNGEQALVRPGAVYNRLAPDSGKESKLAQGGENKAAPGCCALSPDGHFAAVEAKKLSVFKEDGTQAWDWDGAAANTRPVWIENKLVVMGADAHAHAFNPDSNSELWCEPLSGTRAVFLFAKGGLLLADTGSELVCLDPATGKAKWSAKTGDVLIGAPAVVGGRVFAAIKPNRLCLLDAATGEQKAAREWPTWLQAAAAGPAAKGYTLACVDIKRRLTVLDSSTLEDILQLDFPRDLAPVLLHGEKVPSAWALARAEKSEGEVEDFIADLATGDITAPLKSAWLLADAAGFVFAVASE